MVSFFIIKSGYDIMKPSIAELLEASLPEQQEHEITAAVCAVPGILSVHNLRTRRIGNRIAIDLHAVMNGDITLTQAHALATQAEKSIRDKFGQNSIINIHMEPQNR